MRVARTLLEAGPRTAASLAERLSLTTTAVRRHLDVLLAAGQVEATEKAPYGPGAIVTSRGRGRPAKVFSLTAAGRAAFEQKYDDLAVDALRYLAETGGAEAVEGFARHRVAELERRYASTLDGVCDSQRAEVLVTALSRDGFAATLVQNDTGYAVQICQHQCPVGHVAAEFPVFCEAETQAFSRLLGTHVTRLATLAHGDGVCTTLVPRQPAVDVSIPTRTTTEVRS